MNKQTKQRRQAQGGMGPTQRTPIADQNVAGNPTHVGQMRQESEQAHKTIGSSTADAPMSMGRSAESSNPTHPSQMREEARKSGTTTNPTTGRG